MDPPLAHELERLLAALSGRGPLQIAALARRWGNGDRFRLSGEMLKASFLGDLQNEQLKDAARLDALEQWIALGEPRLFDRATLDRILDTVTPRASPALSTGLIAALSPVRSPELGPAMVAQLRRLFSSDTPRGDRAIAGAAGLDDRAISTHWRAGASRPLTWPSIKSSYSHSTPTSALPHAHSNYLRD